MLIRLETQAVRARLLCASSTLSTVHILNLEFGFDSQARPSAIRRTL